MLSTKGKNFYFSLLYKLSTRASFHLIKVLRKRLKRWMTPRLQRQGATNSRKHPTLAKGVIKTTVSFLNYSPAIIHREI